MNGGIVKPPFGTPLRRDHPYAQGLLAYWLMNEGRGNKIYDSSGQDRHGTISGMADPPTSTSGWGAGEHGGALYFDGSNDYITTTATTSNLAKLTVCMWLKSPGISQDVISGAQGATPNFEVFMRTISGPEAYPQFYVYSGGTAVSRRTISVDFQDGLAHFFAGVFDGSNGLLDCYIDGVLDNYTLTNTIPAVTNTDTSTVQICGYNGASSLCFGSMYSVWLYSRALSAYEIAELYAFPYAMFDEEFPAWMHSPVRPSMRSTQAVNRASTY